MGKRFSKISILISNDRGSRDGDKLAIQNTLGNRRESELKVSS
jgi:hypothetical protein